MSYAKMLVVLLWIVAVAVPMRAQGYKKVEIYGGYSFLFADSGVDPGSHSFQPYYNESRSLPLGDLNTLIPFIHEITNPSEFEQLSGYEFSVTYNLNSWLGIEASYQRNKGEQVLDGTIQFLGTENNGTFIWTETKIPLDPNLALPFAPENGEMSLGTVTGFTAAQGFGTADLTRDTFLVGPRISFRSQSAFTPFVHFQAGISRYGRENMELTYSMLSETNEYAPAAYDPSIDILSGRETYSIYGILSGKQSSTGFALSVGGGIDWDVSDWFSLRLIQADYLVANNAFDYGYQDRYVYDYSEYTYEIVWVFQETDPETGGDYYLPYNQETRERYQVSGVRDFSYSVPNDLMKNVRLTGGFVLKF